MFLEWMKRNPVKWDETVKDAHRYRLNTVDPAVFANLQRNLKTVLVVLHVMSHLEQPIDESECTREVCIEAMAALTAAEGALAK